MGGIKHVMKMCATKLLENYYLDTLREDFASSKAG